MVAYIGIILGGFSGLTLIAGGQMQSALRLEYEHHLQDEVRLIAQDIGETFQETDIKALSEQEIEVLLQRFAAQSDGQLSIFMLKGGGQADSKGGQSILTEASEVETASRGEVTVVERKNASGHETLYTAASLLSSQGEMLPVVVQLAVPVDALLDATRQRWLELGGIGLLFILAALLIALLLANSITSPLYQLRDSALKLAEGQMGCRVKLRRRDEIAEVGNAFNKMAQQIESMLEEQKAFASNTSHELRTPLTAIRLRTEALRYEGSLDEATARRYIEEIDNEVIQLSELVQELILLAQFETRRVELGREQVDITRLAKTLVQQEQSRARKKQIELELRIPEEPVLVVANVNHLTVVFRNLLDNALKYTPERGIVTWTITLDKEKQAIKHILQDNGQGVPAYALPHLFERFYRADKAHARDAIPGNGLGLAIVKSIIEAYKGAIILASAGIGTGTSVHVTWPYQSLPEGQEWI